MKEPHSEEANMLYFHPMQGNGDEPGGSERTLWAEWRQKLQQWGMDEAAAVVLESAGPLGLIGAQAIYLGQPFLRGSITEQKLRSLAGLLEDQEQGQAFARFLREDKQG